MNSYILFSPVGPKFLKHLNAAISRIRTEWWEDVKLPTHLTIGLGKAKDAEDQGSREKRIAGMKKEVAELLDKIDKRIYLLPYDLAITPHGHIILKFQPVFLENETDLTRLQTLHEGFVRLGKKQHLYFNPDHIFNNFMPHVSIGRVKNMGKGATLSPEEIKKMTDDLLSKDKKAAMLKELIKIPILNLYQFEFCHGTGNPSLPEGYPGGPRNIVVINKTLAPRDLGVTVAKPHEKDSFMLHFNQKAQAEAAAGFFLVFGISSSKAGASHLPKTVRTLNGNYGLLLNRQEYLTIAGMIKNCYPSIAESGVNGNTEFSKLQDTPAKLLTHSFNLASDRSGRSSEHKKDSEHKKVSEKITSHKPGDNDKSGTPDKSSVAKVKVQEFHQQRKVSRNRNSAQSRRTGPDPLKYFMYHDEIPDDFIDEYNAEVAIRRKAAGLSW